MDGGKSGRFEKAWRKTAQTFLNTLPVVLGVLLLVGLVASLAASHLPADALQAEGFLGALLGACVGSIAAGHPITSYVLGGELMAGGAALVSVTALIVSWVTVGLVQLPVEAQALSRRFAVWRNGICFVSALVIAYLTVFTVRILG